MTQRLAMTELHWPAPWAPVTDKERVALECELRRELAPTHPLYGRSVVATARRYDNDDVLFTLTPDGSCAVVHLTWSSKRESAGFPRALVYSAIGEFFESVAMNDEFV